MISWIQKMIMVIQLTLNKPMPHKLFGVHHAGVKFSGALILISKRFNVTDAKALSPSSYSIIGIFKMTLQIYRPTNVIIGTIFFGLGILLIMVFDDFNVCANYIIDPYNQTQIEMSEQCFARDDMIDLAFFVILSFLCGVFVITGFRPYPKSLDDFK